MNTDLRRSHRYNDFIAVSVTARNVMNGHKEVGPFSGRIINISHHGACLLMSLGTLKAYDVYRSTCNDEQVRLEIEGNTSHDNENFTLSGRPVWMDPFILDDLRAFKIGVEFKTGTPDQRTNSLIENITTASMDSRTGTNGEK